MCYNKMNAKFGIGTQMLSKKVMMYPCLNKKCFFVDLCYLHLSKNINFASPFLKMFDTKKKFIKSITL